MPSKKKASSYKSRSGAAADKREIETEDPRREVKPETPSHKETSRLAEEIQPTEKKDTGPTTSAAAGTQPPAAAAPRSVTQYVVTVDNLTKQPVKIEKLNEETGQRFELSQGEYAALYTYTSAGLYYPTPYLAASMASPAGNNALALAYFQGVADYLKTLRGFK
jgi:hypothetical protein